jgi:hypothetical protein
MKQAMNIRFGRAIFVLLIALSVATLPAALGFAAGSKTLEVSGSTSIPDCDHRHHQNAPSDKKQKTTDDGACLAACAVACFGFTATGLSSITLSLPTSTAPKFIQTSDNVSSQIGNLPFRPPRS